MKVQIDTGVVYLQIDSDILPVEPKNGYDISFDDYDNVQSTEAGTKVRDVTRMNVPTIRVSFGCDRPMLQTMRRHKGKSSVRVKYFNPYSVDNNAMDESLMYIKDYKEKMLADTEEGGIWNVSFTLEDLGDV